MSVIVTLDQAVVTRLYERSDESIRRYAASVRPMYSSEDGSTAEFIGSCVLINVAGKKYVVTAAHVVDWIESRGLYVAGPVGAELVQLVGKIVSTAAPSGRNKDRYDFAFWPVSASAESQLGPVRFINENDVSHNRVDSLTRMYIASGYPMSKNRNKIDNANNSIVSVLWKYAANVVNLPDLANEMGLSGNDHFFLKYEKYSRNSEDQKVSSLSPIGLSGGALIDLGNFAAIETYDTKSSFYGRLAGVLIERNKKHRAIISVKIQKVLQAIRSG